MYVHIDWQVVVYMYVYVCAFLLVCVCVCIRERVCRLSGRGDARQGFYVSLYSLGCTGACSKDEAGIGFTEI